MPAAPSLLIVPYRSKTGKLYSQIPTSGAGDFTVTRNTTATRFNSAGLIESVASGIPRLDYATSGGTAGCPALLVEPSGTNLAPNANLMNVLDTPTVSGGVTFTTGSTDFLAPDGTSGSINKYVGGAASGATQASRYATNAITATASGVHTFSLFVKRGASNPLNFCSITPVGFAGISPDPGRSFFNLASGTAITSGARIENYGNGWYRLISQPLTLAAGDLVGGMIFELANTSGSVSFAASGALNLTTYTWGAQFEAGSIATSYIPTTTAAVTRNADVISVSGAVSGSIGQTEGTMYCEFEATNDASTRRLLTLSDGNQLNRIMIYYTSSAWRAQIQGTSISLGNFTSGYHKIAFAYQQNGVSGNLFASIDGGAVVSGTSATFPTSLNMVNLGKIEDTGSSSFLNGRIRAAALYTTRLTNDELQALTA